MFKRFFAGILAFILSILPCANGKVKYTCKEAVAVTAEFAENESVAIDTPKPVFAADMPESEVISVNGLSRLSINGQLTSPVLFFGNTDFPNPNGVTTSQAGFAADAGIHLHSIIENINYYADLDSISEAEYRQLYSHLHESVKSITDGDPDAKILLRVKVTMPDTGSIPESEIIQYKDKSIKSGVVSMASDLFNEESSRRLAHLVDYVSSNSELSKHIIGYHLENNEWFQYLYRENGQDFSNANNEKFAQWLKVKYPTDRDLQIAWGNPFVKLSTATIPNNLPGNIYDNSKLYKDILFYGTKTQKYVDYHQYICDLTAARISNLARIVKERTENRAIVISFYGYQFELYSSLSGHHNLNWLLSDKNIDGFAGPISYRDRNGSSYAPNSPVGATGAYMSTVDSIQRNGKIWFQESDERTFINHTDEPYEDTFLTPIRSLSDVIEVHKRELGDTIIHGNGLWAMDLWARGWLDDPAIWENIGKLSNLYQAYQNGYGQASRFDVALVVDEYSLHRMANQGPVGDELLGEMQLNLYHAGLSTCYVQLKDVLAGRVDDAKLYIITSAFDMTDEQIEQLQTALHKDGKTTLFMYNFGTMTTQQAKALTGMDFKVNILQSKTGIKMTNQSAVPGLISDNHTARISRAMKVVGGQTETLGKNPDGSVGFAINRQKDYTTIYYGDSLLSVNNLKAIARACGIHVYSDSEDVLMANQNMVVFHAVTAGEKTVTFEGKTDVWDYFNNKWYTDVDSVTFSAQIGETKYLFYGDKEEIENWSLPIYR